MNGKTGKINENRHVLESIRKSINDFLLSADIFIPDQNVDRLAEYVVLFSKWNNLFNFSRYTTFDEIINNLVLPSIILGRNMPGGKKFIDLGTGPGIPGIPVKLLLPGMKAHFLDSSSQAIEFIEICISKLDLTGCHVHSGRAESLAHEPNLRERFNCVIGRSFGPLPIFAEIGSSFCKPGGYLLLHTSRKSSPDSSSYREPMAELGLSFESFTVKKVKSPTPVEVPLLVFKKTGRTNPEYPRTWKAMKRNSLWPA